MGVLPWMDLVLIWQDEEYFGACICWRFTVSFGVYYICLIRYHVGKARRRSDIGSSSRMANLAFRRGIFLCGRKYIGT